MDWKPDAIGMLQVMLRVLCDKQVRTDAVFIHGSSIQDATLDDEMLRMAASLYHAGLTRHVVINGDTAANCAAHGTVYPGYEIWSKKLEGANVKRKDIFLTHPALHTAEESLNLMALVKAHGWGNLTLVAFPHQILRCMLQFVSVMKWAGLTLPVYASTLRHSDWQRPAFKSVLGGGEIRGTYFDHIAAEFERVVRYAKTGPGVKHTPHATIPELLEYLYLRDFA